MWVVKLGGSLAGGPYLAAWLDAIAAAGAGKVVVVPGGGVFADAVRGAQRRWRFSERAAHLMALRAMEQYGLVLCDNRPSFVPCATEPALRRALVHDRVPVWLPGGMTADAREICSGWEVTADSLAAWLCRKLGAELLLLVKSRPAATDRVELLQNQGLLDGAFAGFCRELRCDVYLCGADAANAFSGALASSAPPGTRIATTSPPRMPPGEVLESTP